jgi:hypothetical protein
MLDRQQDLGRKPEIMQPSKTEDSHNYQAIVLAPSSGLFADQYEQILQRDLDKVNASGATIFAILPTEVKVGGNPASPTGPTYTLIIDVPRTNSPQSQPTE